MAQLRKNTILAPNKTILAFPDHYVNLPGKMAADVAASIAKDGVIAAGTVVHIAADGTVTKASNNGNGVIFNDVKYVAGDVHNIAVLVHGFVRVDRLDNAEALVSELIHKSN